MGHKGCGTQGDGGTSRLGHKRDWDIKGVWHKWMGAQGGGEGTSRLRIVFMDKILRFTNTAPSDEGLENLKAEPNV